MMGKNPKMKIIQATHTTELAVNFGRKTKNLIDSDDFKDIFPDVKLAADSKASGRWDTSSGGMYYAVGVGSNLAGRGGDLVIIDDPHSEQTAMSNTGFDDAWDWYTGGPRQRLQPGGSIVLVQTRWSEKDMTGQLMRAMAKDPMADQWEVVELPAIFDDGTPCWPEFWSLEDLNAVRASIPPSKWNAQYQQNPTGEENAIIPREWWKKWTRKAYLIWSMLFRVTTRLFPSARLRTFRLLRLGVYSVQMRLGAPGLDAIGQQEGSLGFSGAQRGCDGPV